MSSGTRSSGSAAEPAQGAQMSSSNNDQTVLGDGRSGESAVGGRASSDSVGLVRFKALVGKRQVDGTKLGYKSKKKIMISTLESMSGGSRCVLTDSKGLKTLKIPRKKKTGSEQSRENDFNDYNQFFTEKVLEAFGTICNNGGGDPLGHGTMGGYRSALADEYKTNKEDLNYHGAVWGEGIRLYQELSQMLSGLARETTQRKRKGEIPVREGKNAFSLEGIKLLGSKMVRTTNTSEYTPSDLTNWPFFALGYNVGLRSESIGNLYLAAISHKNDQLCINNIGDKNHQEGHDLPEDGISAVYACLRYPQICAVLAVAVNVFSTPQRNNQVNADTDEIAVKLFHGNTANHEFGRHLNTHLGSLSPSEKLTIPGGVSDYGTHSERKSMISVLSDQTDGPTGIHIKQRAGHSLGNVTDRYILMKSSGDAFCGRSLFGYAQESEEFAQLPPHWDQETLGVIPWDTLFPDICPSGSGYPAAFKTTVPLLYARLLWSFDWLQENLHPSHPLWRSACLSITKETRDLWIGKLNAPCFDCSCCGMVATGVPAMTRMARENRKTQAAIEAIGTLLTSNHLYASISEALQHNYDGLEARPATKTDLSETLDSKMRMMAQEISQNVGHGFDRVLSAMRPTSGSGFAPGLPPAGYLRAPEAPATPLVVRQEHRYLSFLWQGGRHALPPNYQLKGVTLISAVDYWYFGHLHIGGGQEEDPEGLLAPFRYLHNSDCYLESTQTVLVKLKKCLQWIQNTCSKLYPESLDDPALFLTMRPDYAAVRDVILREVALEIWDLSLDDPVATNKKLEKLHLSRVATWSSRMYVIENERKKAAAAMVEAPAGEEPGF